MRAADHMNFTEGTLWSEPGAGTNAIGTAIAADHAVQVFGPEHFNEVVQRWTCSAAPIHDPDTGELLGVIDLTGDFSTVQPHSLAVATATAQAVEAWLRLEMQEHDLRLRARYGNRVAVAPRLARAGHPQRPPDHRRPGQLGEPRAGWRSRPAAARLTLPSGAHGDRRVGRTGARSCSSSAPRSAAARPATRPLVRLQLLGRERALLEVNGASTELRPRLGEILALLCAHPEGRSADALCADLHGDEGRAASVRVEVSRLRKLLGPWIDTDRYRLTCDVETDVRRVEGLLRAGRGRARRPRSTRGRCCPAREAPGDRRGARAARRLAAPGRDDRQRRRGPVGVGQHGQRPRRPRRLEAAARRPRVPRSAPQPLRGAHRRAAPLADLTRPPGADAAPL